jgi:sugar/nucleoside kinase (ribokinase family)
VVTLRTPLPSWSVAAWNGAGQLGGDGAILVEEHISLQGQAPVPRVINTVGAGDAFLAGYLAAGPLAPEAN